MAFRKDAPAPRLDAFECWLLDGAVHDYATYADRNGLLLALREVTGPARSVAVAAIRSLEGGRDEEALDLLDELLARGVEEEGFDGD